MYQRVNNAVKCLVIALSAINFVKIKLEFINQKI